MAEQPESTLAWLRRIHTACVCGKCGQCEVCMTVWPCTISLLLAALADDVPPDVRETTLDTCQRLAAALAALEASR